MGWFNMPATVQESAFERQIKEGKAYQLTEEFSIPAGATIWLYIQLPADKDVVLESRSLQATSGPVRYKVYPNAILTGTLGVQYVPEKLNTKKNGPALTQMNRVTAADINITGISPSDKKLVVAGQDSGSRGTGSQVFQSYFKVYAAGTKIAVSIQNSSSITSFVELQYLWAEDVE